MRHELQRQSLTNIPRTNETRGKKGKKNKDTYLRRFTPFFTYLYPTCRDFSTLPSYYLNSVLKEHIKTKISFDAPIETDLQIIFPPPFAFLYPFRQSRVSYTAAASLVTPHKRRNRKGIRSVFFSNVIDGKHVMGAQVLQEGVSIRSRSDSPSLKGMRGQRSND